jgi:hypothetical protein
VNVGALLGDYEEREQVALKCVLDVGLKLLLVRVNLAEKSGRLLLWLQLG